MRRQVFQSEIEAAISDFFYGINQQIFQIVRSGTKINYPLMVSQLLQLGDKATLGQVLGVIYDQTKADLSSVIASIPTSSVNASVNVPEVVNFLEDQIPSLAPFVSTGAITILLETVAWQITSAKVVQNSRRNECTQRHRI